MNLYIDSTNNQKTVIRIGDLELIKEYDSPREQNVLAAIAELLDRQNLSKADITGIEVNPGPGSFTGTRVGVAVANALAFALGVKVNGKNPPIEPVYNAPPTSLDSQTKKV